MSKTLVLIDFENLFMGGLTHYNLAITQAGLKKLLDSISSHGEISPDNITVAACWQDYRSYETYFSDSMNDIVRFTEKGKNIADGYLIVHSVLKYEQIKNDVQSVVIVAGDGVYSGLVRHVLKNGKKAIVYTWESSKNHVYKINDNMDIKILEDVFQLENGKETEQGFFISGHPTETEIGLMQFINKAKEKSAFHTYFARTMVNRSQHEARYKDFDEFSKASKFLDDCESQGIINITRESDTRKGFEKVTNKVMRLNQEHPKVKKFLSRNK